MLAGEPAPAREPVPGVKPARSGELVRAVNQSRPPGTFAGPLAGTLTGLLAGLSAGLLAGTLTGLFAGPFTGPDLSPCRPLAGLFAELGPSPCRPLAEDIPRPRFRPFAVDIPLTPSPLAARRCWLPSPLVSASVLVSWPLVAGDALVSYLPGTGYTPVAGPLASGIPPAM